MKMKIFGLFLITRNQFVIIETLLFSFFFLLTVFFFSWSVPGYVDDPLILFHAKYLKYITLFLSFSIVIETQYYLNKFISKQLKINELQKIQIEFQNDEIMQSIRYASRIQEAILPHENKLPKNLEYFIFYKPKDIVSGDFYWFAQKHNKTIIVAGDCTGHGVSGAFMSILGISSLNDILNENDKDLGSDEILNLLREKVISSLKQELGNIISVAGMDLALIKIDFNNQEVEFSGAKNPLFLVRKRKADDTPENLHSDKTFLKDYVLTHFQPDKMPIGLYPDQQAFSKQKIKVEKGDTLYLFSDGFVDQMGGSLGKKLKNQRLKDMFLRIQEKNMFKQEQIINDFFSKWKGDYEQTDDVIIFGIKI